MGATVTLDDDRLKTAHEYTGVAERAELIREALKSLIAREAGRTSSRSPGLPLAWKRCAERE
jgi:metal-responsive CopG/Arc/MetJ family transcriptional regulator